jgi:DNA-directed RNA polymerase subunit M/transcription elongation factor TFIIS
MDNICRKCRILLMPKEEGDKVVVECMNCGFKRDFEGWAEHLCTKCSHTKATVILHEMVRGDEGTTTMYKCINCGHIDKEGWMGR